jgi:hypothetical protein
MGPSHKAPARLGSSGLSLLGASGKWGKKKEKNSCLTYVLSRTALDCGPLATFLSLEHVWCFHGPFRKKASDAVAAC